MTTTDNYRRLWYAANPDAVLRYRIESARNLLAKHGYLTVQAPGTPPPWTDAERLWYDSAIRAAIERCFPDGLPKGGDPR